LSLYPVYETFLTNYAKIVSMNQKQLQQLIRSATTAYHRAYAPYSQFPVGAAVLDELGTIHHGCNVENAAYPSGSCAEEQAIGSMVAAGGRRIRKIVIIGTSDAPVTPCGACRQRIREFGDSQTVIEVHDVKRGLQKTYGIDALLPDAFGPHNLG